MSDQSEQGTAPPRGDWWKLAGVAVLAVVLGLIGFNVASSFQPSTGPAAGPTSTEGRTTTSTPGTSSPAIPSTTGSQPASTTEQVIEEASLALSEENLDLGEDRDTAEVEVVHTGGGPGTWSIEAGHSAFSLTPSQGDLAAGETAPITVTLDRAQIEEGEFEAILTLTWGAGQAEVLVTAVHEDNPIIHNPSASPQSVQVAAGGACSPTQTTVSARVRDTTEVDRVIARWSPDGSSTRETIMRPVGNDIYEGLIGPFEVVRTDSVKIIAFDVRENAGGAAISLSVVECPEES